MSEYIVCSLADKRFALNFLEVEEVMNVKKGTPLPFSEAWHKEWSPSVTTYLRSSICEKSYCFPLQMSPPRTK